MHPKARRVTERAALHEKLRAIEYLVCTHILSENDDAMVVGMLRGIVYRLAELDAEAS